MKVNILTQDGSIISVNFNLNVAWKFQNRPAEFCFFSHGNAEYFVKRQNTIFSGWGLITKAISEKKLLNVPRIVSIAKHQEYYYFFSEKLNGTTLDEYLEKLKKISLMMKIITRPANLDSKRLAYSVFASIKSINDSGYWYSDLCTKNIFITNKKEFKLIDIDSAFPHDTAFSNNLSVSFEYSPLLIKFAKEHARDNNFNIALISGICINQAEVIGFAIDSKNNFRIPKITKTSVLHNLLIKNYQKEYCDLFFDIIRNKPDWDKVLRLMSKIFS